MNIRDLAPDIILSGGTVYTLDADRTVAQALAVKDGRIVAVGGDAELEALAGPATRRIDLAGRTAVPGIFDSHNHMLEVGTKLADIRLDECTAPEQMMELVRERAARTPPGQWIVGQGWNEGLFPGGRLPTRWDIDPATADHPVVLMRFFNTDLANSAALRLAGIDRHTPDPENGRIERDAGGEPNGLLRAAAKGLVRRLIPPPTPDALTRALRLACAELHRYGISSVIDPGLTAREIAAYHALYRDGGLTMRANLMPSWHGFRDDEEEAALDQRALELGIASGLGDEWLRIGALKMAIDGGTTPRTAFMYEPFEGETEVVAFNRLPVETLRRYFRTAQEAGWDVGIHCCGDRAQDMAVDALALAAQEWPRPDARHSIIHGYFPTERALERMARHRIAAVLQPSFIYWEGDLLFRDVGARRAARYKPARTYLDRGIVVTASSDVTSTVSPNPFIGLYALVARRDRLGEPIAPQEAIGRDEALWAYTAAGAWLTHEEALKGTLEPGKLADVAVLDRDYFAVPTDDIKDVQVEMTLVGGNVVYARET